MSFFKQTKSRKERLMILCKICNKRKDCKEICPEMKKELSTRGVSPRQKDKTYIVDMFYLEETKNPFNDFQKEVARKLVRDDWDNFFCQFDFKQAMDKILLPREKLIIQLVLEGFIQQEIASKMKISQKRVSTLFRRALKKLKKFYLEGV